MHLRGEGAITDLEMRFDWAFSAGQIVTKEGGAFEALTRVAGNVAAESDGSEGNMWDPAESTVEMVGEKQNYSLLQAALHIFIIECVA